MADYDLVVRGGTVVTGADTMRADVGIRQGRIAAIGDSLTGPRRARCRRAAGDARRRRHATAISSSCSDGGGADEEISTPAAPPPGRRHHQRHHLLHAVQGPRHPANRWPNIAGARRRRWWTTASTRSSPMPPTR